MFTTTKTVVLKTFRDNNEAKQRSTYTASKEIREKPTYKFVPAAPIHSYNIMLRIYTICEEKDFSSELSHSKEYFNVRCHIKSGVVRKVLIPVSKQHIHRR